MSAALPPGAAGAPGARGDGGVAGAPSRMLAEIREQPAVLERALRHGTAEVADAVRLIRSVGPEMVVVAARGSSAYAGLYARSVIGTRLGLPVVLAPPAIRTVYEARVRWPRGVMIGISQGGRGPDVCAVFADAAAAGMATIAVTNDPASPLADLADVVVPCRAGPEAITATKSYLAEIAVLGAIVAAWQGDAGLAAALQRAPDAVAAAIARAEDWLADDRGVGFVTSLAAADRALVVSRGHDHATALEVALKITETCAIAATGLSAAEFLHGFAVLAAPDVPFIAVRPDGPAGPSVDRAIEAAAGAGGPVLVVGGREVAGSAEALVVADGLAPEVAPLVHVVPGQVVAEAASRRRGRDPDQPPGLVKIIRTH